MIFPIGYNDRLRKNSNPSFKAIGNFKFSGKILLDGKERVTRTFIVPLKSGKRLFVEYKNGLLRKSNYGDNNEIITKKYFYTADEKLIRVEQDGEDVFTKDCGYVDSDIISYYESINGGKIELGYDTSGRKISAVVKPKLTQSLFTYLGNTISEMRYKITNAEIYKDGMFIYPGESGKYELESKFIKRLDRNLDNGNISVTTYNGYNKTTTIEKDKKGNIVSTYHIWLDKTQKPIRSRKFDANENLIFDKETTYDDNGLKINDIIYDKLEGEFYKDITYDKNGNIIMSKISDMDKNVYTTIKNSYNENGDLSRTVNLDAKGKVVEEENFIYDKNGEISESHYKGYCTDSDDILEGHYYYKNGIKNKEIEILKDNIEESYYNDKGKIIKYVIKDKNNNILRTYSQTYYNKYNKIKKTTLTDSNDNIVYYIDHSYKYKGDDLAHTKIFRKANGEFIFKEIIINSDNNVEHIYLDKQNKIVNPQKYAQYIYE